MNILLAGTFNPFSIGTSYLKAFKKMGFNPSTFDTAEEYDNSFPSIRNRFTDKIIAPLATGELNKKLLSTVSAVKPDMVFVLKGQWLTMEALNKIKSLTGAKLMNFNTDDPFNTNRGASNRLIRNSIPAFDLYFTWSKRLITKLEKAGAKEVRYLPFAADTSLHHPSKFSKHASGPYNSNISFVGNWDKEREKWLSALNGYDLSIWGTDYWDKRCTDTFLRSCWKGKPAMGKDMSQVIQSSKISLNVLREQNKGSHNMRTFEIPACGGFMLHERSDEVLDIYEEDREIACFSSVEELKSKADYYSRNGNLRNDMAHRAYEKVRRHTYLERARQVIKAYYELIQSTSATAARDN